MGLLTKKQPPDVTQVADLPTFEVSLPKGLDSHIVIVGGGPSGIHFASLLRKLGYHHVTILEKSDGTEKNEFGKTFSYKLPETGDVPHELGTCYLSWSYDYIRELLEEYNGEGAVIEPGGGRHGPYGRILTPSPHLEKDIGHPTGNVDDWLFANREKVKIKNKFWEHILPDGLQAIGFAVDVAAYRKLHKRLLGKYDYHGLPPRPGTEIIKELNCTFADLMKKNDLVALLELCVVGFGSYGLSYDVPALYGLWFITPNDVDAFIVSRLSLKVKTVQLVKGGYCTLWQNMIKKEGIVVKYNCEVTKINRSLEDLTKQITVETVSNETILCDYVVFAAPFKEAFCKTVVDVTPFEQEVADHLKTVGLVVSIWKTAKKEGETALTFYPESLQPAYTPKPSGEVYAERNSMRSYDWDHDKNLHDRYDVAYQYYEKPVPFEDSLKAVDAALNFITDKEKTIDPTSKVPEPELIKYKNWDYFPHFTQDGVQKMLPWRVMEEQGKYRTAYVGSSLCFESVEDVTKYNVQVVKKLNFAKYSAKPST